MTIIDQINQANHEHTQRLKAMILEGVRNMLFPDTASAISSGTTEIEDFGTEEVPTAVSTPAPVALRPVIGRAKGEKRTAEEFDALTERVRRYLTNNPGERLETMAVGLAVPSAELKLPLQKLRAEKVIRVAGRRRGMRYYLKVARS